jgi:hypothetical protein
MRNYELFAYMGVYKHAQHIKHIINTIPFETAVKGSGNTVLCRWSLMYVRLYSDTFLLPHKCYHIVHHILYQLHAPSIVAFK